MPHGGRRPGRRYCCGTGPGHGNRVDGRISPRPNARPAGGHLPAAPPRRTFGALRMVDLAPDAALVQLRIMCGAIGTQVPLWTQGAGGNVSVKAAGRLYIKASGQRLDGVDGPTTYAALPVAPLRAQVAELAGQMAVQGRTPTAEAIYATALTEHRDATLGRPSMESGMHALLPGRYVAHFHALSAVLMGHHELLQPGYVRALCAAQGVVADFVPATLPGLQQLVVAHEYG
ncbi:MAG: hypothetical protein EOO40_08735, partial [Deltaproteobacteria bacterium]